MALTVARSVVQGLFGAMILHVMPKMQLFEINFLKEQLLLGENPFKWKLFSTFNLCANSLEEE